MFTIAKQFAFSASHHLDGLRDGHPCGRLHGHNYVVEVVLERDVLNEVGFVTDYGDLAMVREFIDNEWDHQDLNAWMEGQSLLGNPTAETLAALVFDLFKVHLPALVAVRVSETPKTWAEYRP